MVVAPSVGDVADVEHRDATGEGDGRHNARPRKSGFGASVYPDDRLTQRDDDDQPTLL